MDHTLYKIWAVVLLVLAYRVPNTLSTQELNHVTHISQDDDAWTDPGVDFEGNDAFEFPTEDDLLKDDDILTIGFCPENKPYRYAEGRKCCAGDMEDGGPDGPEGCNGSVLTLKSTCCVNKKRKSCPFSLCVDIATHNLLDEKRREIEAQIGNVEDPSQFEEYVKTEDSLALYQYKILDDVMKSGAAIDLNDEDVAKIYNDKNLLEPLMTHGDIPGNQYGPGNNWVKAMKILARILREDPNAQEGVKFRLAVAIALTFSTPVISSADKEEIDGIARYHNFARWADEGVLMAPFYNLNIYEMRFVVHGSARDEEYVWARENVPEQFRDPNEIGRAVFNMVTYTTGNPLKGIPKTLENMHIYGGVCGTVCKFGAGVTQAFGMPATNLGQPGHCAFTWLVNGMEWELANRVRDWDMSQFKNRPTWSTSAALIRVMHELQKDPLSYQISEKMRILSRVVDPTFKCTLIEGALRICPTNYGLYKELNGITSSQSLVNRNALELDLLPYMESYINREVEDIAWMKPVTTCGPQEKKAFAITRESKVWYTSSTDNAWAEIDLRGTFSIDGMSIQWHTQSVITSYNVLAMIDGNFVTVKSQVDDEDADSRMSIMSGWDGVTSRIRMEIIGEGEELGVRQVKVNGTVLLPQSIVSLSRPVSTSGNSDQAGNLVDGDGDTTWDYVGGDSWIDIVLDGMCVLEDVQIDWNGAPPEHQSVQYLVGGEVREAGGIASRLWIELSGTLPYSISEITATGHCFTMKEVMKMKVQEVMDRHDIGEYSVIQDISGVIDDANCDACL